MIKDSKLVGGGGKVNNMENANLPQRTIVVGDDRENNLPS
jgi:hypothetical protein